ncbi:MAG TPA: response regulator transcription factor [Candidatus Dormibacteraeota bacterium]
MNDHGSDLQGFRFQVLLIEADEAYCVAIAACIRQAGGRVEPVATPDRAFAALERKSFDLLVWGVSAEEVARRVTVMGELRLRSEAPLVIIDPGSDSAQLDLEAGADHWLSKPFVPGALVGSIRAALRRPANSVVPAALKAEVWGMTLDGGRRQLAFGGSEVFLTRQEWDLFSILFSHPNRFITAQEILLLGWRAGDHAAEQIRTYVHRLRLKLEPLKLPCQLLSQHGQGYCLAFASA